MFEKAYVTQDSSIRTDKLIRQICNLTIVYFAYSIAMWGFKQIIDGTVNKAANPSAILWLWCKTIAPYWYLYVLLGCYCFYWMLSRMRVKINTVLLIALVLNIISAFINIQVNLFEFRRIMYYGLFFVIGVAWSKKEDKLMLSKRVFCILLIATVCLMIIVWNWRKQITSIPVVNTVIALCISIIIIHVFKNSQRLTTSRVFSVCGHYALEIYVIHCYFTAGFRTVFIKLGMTNSILNLVINSVVSVSCAVAFAVVCKRTGLNKLLFRPASLIFKTK